MKRAFTMKTIFQDILRALALLLVSETVTSVVIMNSTRLEAMLEKYMEVDGKVWASMPRSRRAISESDVQDILDLHNKLRGQVYPQASNMEYMVGKYC